MGHAGRRTARTPLLEPLSDDPIRLVDIGARGGVDPRWNRLHPYLDVLGFEPDPSECERLNARAGELPYRSRFLPYALGREVGEVTFHVCRWPVASSVFEPNPDLFEDFPHAADLMAVTERRRMATVPLDDVLGDEQVTPDCLKIDVEGAELDVLRGSETALAGTLVLDVEVELEPLLRGQPLFGDVDRHLRDRGWRLLGLKRVAWRRTAGRSPHTTGHGGQVVSADALYFNGEALRRGLPASRALKFAAIMAAYRQHDFALSVLRRPPLTALDAVQRTSLEAALIPSATALQRIAMRATRRLDSERRRRIADALHGGEATVRQDAHHF